MKFSSRFAFLIFATVLISGSAEAMTLNCEPVTPPPADQGYSAGFLHATMVLGREMTVDLGVAELDIFGSCGAQNIGKFDTGKDKFTEDPATGDISFNRTFSGPIDPTLPKEEELSLKTVSETASSLTIDILYRSSCFNYYTDIKSTLICQKVP